MKKMRLHIYIVIGVFLTMVIVGSFLDLQINTAIFQRNNGFGITVAALSMFVGYGVISAMGGVFLYHGLNIAKPAWQKIIFTVVAAGVLVLTVILCARKEFFGINGWNIPNLVWLGYLLSVPVMGACMAGGYFVGKKANNPQLWILMLVATAFVVLALLLGTTAVKSLLNRPRYRIVVNDQPNLFYNWWERCSNSGDIIQQYADKGIEITKEEFKSFPSGHVSVAAMAMFGVVLYPFVRGKELKYQVVFFYVGLAYTLLVAFTRMLVGAHFLSDVGMGGLITVLCMYGFYEVALRNPKIYEAPSLEEVKEEKPQE